MNIPRGRDAAITIGALAESYQLPRRAVEQAIEDMRREGVPVCSGSEGVWIGTDSEMEETIASLQRRLVTQYRTIRALRAALRRHRAIVEGQTRLPWDVAA